MVPLRCTLDERSDDIEGNLVMCSSSGSSSEKDQTPWRGDGREATWLKLREQIQVLEYRMEVMRSSTRGRQKMLDRYLGRHQLLPISQVILERNSPYIYCNVIWIKSIWRLGEMKGITSVRVWKEILCCCVWMKKRHRQYYATLCKHYPSSGFRAAPEYATGMRIIEISLKKTNAYCSYNSSESEVINKLVDIEALELIQCLVHCC